MDSEGVRKRTATAATASAAAVDPAADSSASPSTQTTAKISDSKIAHHDDDDKLKKYTLTKKAISSHPSASWTWNTFVPSLLTFFSLWTRLFKIGVADFVVWDEAHFGKFASHYITGEFYFDVHPPLGKMLLGLSGYLVGYNGSFAFESGAKYPPELGYGGMRVFSALFGAFMVPLAYLTGMELGLSGPACGLLGLMVLMDMSLLTISRFILLDSMLLFFTALSVYCLAKFRNYQVTAPLSFRWYMWLALTGLSIGSVLSVKWVGLFAVALVGLHTIEDLWTMLGDVKMPIRKYARHWIARIVFLILVPATVYVLSFVLHFKLLYKSGTGDAQMSSLFQANLVGNDFQEYPLVVAIGSKITLKNNGHGGGLLHSHVQTYPAGSKQQQVTCYHHKDANNEWTVIPAWGEEEPADTTFLKDGDVIRLFHTATGRNLHSHSVKAPITKTQNEVSCYGNMTLGDDNDLWKIEIVDDVFERNPVQIKSLTTRIRLRHVPSDCLLRSGSKTLPEWGFKQAEVTCAKDKNELSPNFLWNVEQHWNDRLPAGGANVPKTSFWKDFVDLNVAMWTSNNALTPDPDKEPDSISSKPSEWPLATVGLRMCGWGDDEIKFFLLGHPIVWWGSTGSIGVFGLLCFVYAVRRQRQYNDWAASGSWDNFYFASKVGFLGWFLHYVPSFIMARVTYLHHYFPAVYFAIILFAFIVDHIAGKLGVVFRNLVIFALAGVISGVFFHFADFAFGIHGPASAYSDRQWLETWNIYDE